MKISALNDTTGAAVDWWFIYKLPSDATSRTGAGSRRAKKTTGREYLYLDARQKKPIALSRNKIDTRKSAVARTLAQLCKRGADLGYILYNDQKPPKSSDTQHGHSKGVLAFDVETDTAIWMLHSWPHFPRLDVSNMFKSASPEYGQTFLCVTLKDVATANLIAQQMYYETEPLVFKSKVPKKLSRHSHLYQLQKHVNVNEADPPSDVPFHSRGGESFRMIAKNRHWDDDFWVHLVGPHLGADIEVETWRRGTRPSKRDGSHVVQDVLEIDLKKLGVDVFWNYTKDHAKWATSAKADWVCVADINRDTSQEKRGGGTICFRNKKLWKALRSIERFDPLSKKKRKNKKKIAGKRARHK